MPPCLIPMIPIKPRFIMMMHSTVRTLCQVSCYFLFTALLSHYCLVLPSSSFLLSSSSPLPFSPPHQLECRPLFLFMYAFFLSFSPSYLPLLLLFLSLYLPLSLSLPLSLHFPPPSLHLIHQSFHPSFLSHLILHYLIIYYDILSHLI